MASAPGATPRSPSEMDTRNSQSPSAAEHQHQGTETPSIPGDDLTMTASREANDLPAVEPVKSEPFVPHYIDGLELLLVVGAVTVASFLVLLDSSIIATAIPKITSEFHSLPDISWYGSAFQISSAALQPLVGKIYTHFSLKWTFVTFFAIFEIGSLICAVAPSSKVLIVGRAIAGMGVAGVFAGGLTIINAAIAPAKKAINTGIMIGFAQLGVVIGPLIGGAFTTNVSWRWCFYINLPLGAIVLGGVCFIRIENQQPVPPLADTLRNLHRRLDLIGFVIFAGAAIMLLLALEGGGNQYPWDSATTIGLFCGSGGALIAFIGWTWKKGDDALIPPKLLKQHIVVACSCLTLFMMAATFIAAYWLPVYFQTVRGANAIDSGVDMLPNILPSVVFGVLFGFILGKVGYYLPQAIAGTGIIAISLGLISTLTPTTSTATWAGFLVLLGAGRGMMQQVSFSAIPASCPPKMIPIGLSLMVFGQYIGGSIFLSLSNVVFTSSLKSNLMEYAPHANASAIIAAGASAEAVRAAVSAELLPGVLLAYSKSISNVFYLATGGGCALFITSFFVGWVDTRPKKEDKKTKDEEAGQVDNTTAEGSVAGGSETERNEKQTTD